MKSALLQFLTLASPSEFNAQEFVALSPWPWWAFVLLAGLMSVALFLSWRSTQAAPTKVRVLLQVLRVLAALFVLVLLAEPGLRKLAKSRSPNRVVVALDTSLSMEQKEEGRTRIQRGAKEVLSLMADIEKREQPFVVETFAFDEGVRALSKERLQALASGREKAAGLASDLSAPFDLLDARATLPLGGLVVVSDGASTTKLREDAPFVRALREQGAAAQGIFIGMKNAYRDVALTQVDTDEFAFVRNKVQASVHIRQSDFAGANIRLTLSEDGKPLKSVTHKLLENKEGEDQKVTFEFEPKNAGKRVYTISAPVLDGEAVIENNRIDFSLQVIRDRIRVLQLVGRPSWDERFVRRLLKENPSVDLISFFILRTPTDVSGAPNTELSLIPFPTRELFTEELNTFDVVIFQDFNFRPYNMQPYLKNVKDFVTDAGGGFMMIGGELSFSEAGYERTAIADILPVTLQPGHGRIHIDPFHPRLTSAGRTHPITDLGDLVDADSAYEALPKLVGVNTVAGLAPGAETLLAHPFLNAGGTPHPVVSVREVGRGRTLAITTDTTWKWALPHVGQGGRGDAHRRFFANALRWLIRDPELSRVKVNTNLSTYEPGQNVQMNVRTFDSRYAPQGGVEVTLEIQNLELGKGEVQSETLVSDEQGSVRFVFSPQSAGTYRVRAKAKVGEKAIGSDDDAFFVKAIKTENTHIEARRDFLDDMAARTGGQVVLEGASSKLKFKDHQKSKVHRQKTEALWSTPLVLAPLMLLFALEWWWRRRRGFV